MQKITEHIYVLEHQPEVDRPWIGYICGDDESTLIDAGNSKAHAKRIQGKLDELKLPVPDHILITHSHWDHSYGIAGWKKIAEENLKENSKDNSKENLKENSKENGEKCLVYSGRETFEILKKMQAWQWTMEEFEEHIRTNEIPLFCRPHMLLEYPELQGIEVALPDQVIEEEMELSLGGVRIMALPVQSPHVDDSVIYYVPEEQVLFVGDAYCEEVIGEDWIDRLEIRKAFIERINKLDYRLVLTGHHGVMSREEFLEQYGGN